MDVNINQQASGQAVKCPARGFYNSTVCAGKSAQAAVEGWGVQL